MDRQGERANILVYLHLKLRMWNPPIRFHHWLTKHPDWACSFPCLFSSFLSTDIYDVSRGMAWSSLYGFYLLWNIYYNQIMLQVYWDDHLVQWESHQRRQVRISQENYSVEHSGQARQESLFHGVVTTGVLWYPWPCFWLICFRSQNFLGFCD